MAEMPPSARFDFVTRMPANNKWAWNQTSALKNLPEYLIDINHVYRFTYDQGLNDIEDEFAQGAASGGDLSFDGQSTISSARRSPRARGF